MRRKSDKHALTDKQLIERRGHSDLLRATEAL